MATYNGKREEKKRGLWAALSGLLRGGSSSMGGASSGFGSAAGGGLGGLFATKAGILGVVLGGATIAAGVGVVYNFMGPSSKQVYTPDLFQNGYLEEEAQKAGMERARERGSASGDSTLDMFREQAQKDGLGGLASEGAGDSEKEPSAPATDEAAAEQDGAGAAGAEGPGGYGAPKLQAAPSFSSKGGGSGGGSGTSIPRLQAGGGLSGGIGGQFAQLSRPKSGLGSSSGMKAAASRAVKGSKIPVGNFKKKGALGQAKFAGKSGTRASYSPNLSGARTEATTAFDGGTTGAGDIGAPGLGAGLGGSGISRGASLKSNDPSLSSNNSTPPPAVSPPADVSPWKKWTDRAMYAMLAAAVLIMLTSVFAKAAAGTMGLAYYAAYVCAYAAMAAAALVIMSGLMLMKFEQKMMGMMYMVIGAMLMWQAYQALSGIDKQAAKQLPDGKFELDGKKGTFDGNKFVADPPTKAPVVDAQIQPVQQGVGLGEEPLPAPDGGATKTEMAKVDSAVTDLENGGGSTAADRATGNALDGMDANQGNNAELSADRAGRMSTEDQLTAEISDEAGSASNQTPVNHKGKINWTPGKAQYP